MSILSDYEDLVDATITNKTTDYSITPQNVGDMLKELAQIVPDLTSSGASVPLGTIIMYSPVNTSEFDGTGLGIAANVLGWAICNGNNATPDLRGKFVVGYNPSDTDYDAIGETGGQKYVTEVLAHEHLVAKDTQVGSGSPGPTSTSTIAWSYSNGTSSQNYDLKGVTGQVANVGLTSETGVAQPDNRPPYYTVLYIKKIA